MVAMFRDATRESIIPELRSQQDWDRYKLIDQDARKRTKDEVDGFERDRPARLAVARKALIDKAGSFTLEHPAPFGSDKFDKTAIERQAVTNVFNDHQSTLLRIKTDEADAYRALKDDIHARENIRGVARDTFARATDRRTGEDRRMPTRDR
tara:strand:+ start:22548 stop:23003 length:456 start_codon:yes stop_codon:yes gene_type:complete